MKATRQNPPAKKKLIVAGNCMVSCRFCSEFLKRGLQEKFDLTHIIEYADFLMPRQLDKDGVMLPAQMFRYSRDLAMEMDPGFTYSLQSEWPINKQNGPKTPIEKEGPKFLGNNPGKNFYGEETLGEKTFFTAVYPDVAVSSACVDCHNHHKDSPRSDFKMGEVMGGVIIRIPLDSPLKGNKGNEHDMNTRGHP